MRDQILEFHLPFPRTYNWPWNCDSILLWYWPNTHHQRTKGTSKNEPKYTKYTHNTLCKRPFLTFSHPRQWFHSFTKMLNFFKNHTLQVVGWWWKIFIVFEIWPIKLESLISFRWQNIGSVQLEAKVAEVKTGNKIEKIKLQMHPDLKSLSVIQFMFSKEIAKIGFVLVGVRSKSGLRLVSLWACFNYFFVSTV